MGKLRCVNISQGDECGSELDHQRKREKNRYEDGKKFVLEAGDTAVFLVERETKK